MRVYLSKDQDRGANSRESKKKKRENLYIPAASIKSKVKEPGYIQS